MVGAWGSRSHQPLGCNHDKRPSGIAMILSVALLGFGAVYLQGEPILLQEWPKGDPPRVGGMSGKPHRLLTLANSLVRLGATNR